MKFFSVPILVICSLFLSSGFAKITKRDRYFYDSLAGSEGDLILMKGQNFSDDHTKAKRTLRNYFEDASDMITRWTSFHSHQHDISPHNDEIFSVMNLHHTLPQALGFLSAGIAFLLKLGDILQQPFAIPFLLFPPLFFSTILVLFATPALQNVFGKVFEIA